MIFNIDKKIVSQQNKRSYLSANKEAGKPDWTGWK